MTKTTIPAEPVAKLEDVKSVDRAGLARFFDMSVVTTYRLQEQPDFPAPLRISGRPRWLVSELVAYVQAKADARPSVRRKRATEADEQPAAG